MGSLRTLIKTPASFWELLPSVEIASWWSNLAFDVLVLNLAIILSQNLLHLACFLFAVENEGTDLAFQYFYFA